MASVCGSSGAKYAAGGLKRACKQRLGRIGLPFGLIQQPEIIDGRDRLRVVRPQHPRQYLDSPFVKRLGLVIAAQNSVKLRQIDDALLRGRMLLAQHAFEDGKHALEQRLGFGIAALSLIDGRQTAGAQHRGRAVRAACLLGRRQRLLGDARRLGVFALRIELHGLLVERVDVRRTVRPFRGRGAGARKRKKYRRNERNPSRTNQAPHPRPPVSGGQLKLGIMLKV